MTEFSLTYHFEQNMTTVPNQFIDNYMPQANGSFVKVYLYLLRQMANPKPQLTVETMADMLSNTETDILRALRYWERQELLAITESKGQIVGVTLLPPGENNPRPKEETDGLKGKEEHTHPEEKAVLPERHTYSPLQAEALKKDTEIDSCLSMVEALLGTTLGDAHMQLVLYLMSDLGFSLDLVITLYETALSRGKRKPRYIEAIALDWAKKGIHTAEEAQEEVSSFNGTYKVVSAALGIKRTLAPAEKAVIDKWEAYQFPDAVLEEACNRTVLQSGDTNLNYTAKILADWHRQGVTCLQDIIECDKSYFRKKTAAANKSIAAGKNKAGARGKNKFQNFPQREYSKEEYASLEKQLLHQ